MKILFRLAPVLLPPLAAFLASCSQTPITVTQRSLQQSGNVSFVCRGDDRKATGHKLDECPELAPTGTVSRRLVGLVTQTATNEVALVDLYGGSVIDVDKSTPGFSFLRVGARPGAIVSSPGGAASFVGVSGLQKNGIFALPSSCLRAPDLDEPALDLTTWSACALTSRPDDITMLVDPSDRTSCDAGSPPSDPEVPEQKGRVCPANLVAEKGPKGRRKLLVSLPEEHKLVLLDAQALLNRTPGEFAQCDVERVYPLSAALPGAASPVLPADLVPTGDAASCPVVSYPPLQSGAQPTPGGLALSDDRLYVADTTLPVVHRIDVADPCTPREVEPLLPRSYLAPERVVTTSRVAVSPVTPKGKQFVYAIDDNDQPTASVMAFDVSTTDAPRTPLVLEGAPRQPYLPPDRIRFDKPVADLRFVMRDFPKPDATGSGSFGLSCNPYPGVAATEPSALYRPNADYTDGARPRNLRGLFGLVMLTGGQVVVIDVEDFDADCRRPITRNTSSIEDFRGCKNDVTGHGFNDALEQYFTTDGSVGSAPTVTNESSCQIIEPHRPRAASLAVSSSLIGLRAPTLRAFPQFTNPDPATVVAVDQQPRMQAVDFANPDPASAAVPAQVYVGTQLYANCATNPQSYPCNSPILPAELTVDPNAELLQNTLSLPLAEPRSYAAEESPVLTYEGRLLVQDRKSGYLELTSDPVLLRDPDAAFCSSFGVQDSDAILAEADRYGLPVSTQSDAVRAAWGLAHADYVQITGDFPVSTDRYWQIGKGLQCAALLDKPGEDSRTACGERFGNIDNPAVLNVARDLSIVKAYNDRLEVTPRNPQLAGVTAESIDCCFPSGTAYTVRAAHQWLLSAASGLTDIASGADGRCVHTAACDPKKKFFRSRAFEVCKRNPTFDENGRDVDPCQVIDANVGCVVENDDQIPVKPGQPGGECIFENLTSRFAVYRKGQESTRGMAFSWQTTGGFTPLTMSLVSQTNQVMPQSMNYLSEYGYVAVVDSQSLGLVLFNLDSLGVVSPSPFY